MDDLHKSRPTIKMPIPSSYNDITTDPDLRDHVGTVWYDRKFFVPKSWAENQHVWIRFGSVHYEAYVVSFESVANGLTAFDYAYSSFSVDQWRISCAA